MGKASIGVGLDRIKTLVSMATDSSHRVIMKKTVLPLFLSCFSSDLFYTCMGAWMNSIRDPTTDCGVS